MKTIAHELARLFWLALALAPLLSTSSPASAQIVPGDTSLICTTYADGLIVCRDRSTGRRVQECKRLPDNRVVCQPVR